MAETKTYHVAPGKKGQWEVKEEGSSRPDSVHASQDAALRRAQDLIAEGGEIRVHESPSYNWPKEASERALGTRIQGEKAVAARDVSLQDEEPRGVDAMEQEGESGQVTDADTSPSMVGQNTRTPADLQDKVARQDRK
jgi:hypothetical protein